MIETKTTEFKREYTDDIKYAVVGLRVRTGRLFVKEDNICLDTLLVKDTCRQTKNRMQIGSLQQLLADDLTGAALKQNVVRDHNGGLAGCGKDGIDMLNKVELFVGTGRLEILAVVDQILFLLFALLVGHDDGGFLAEGRIGQNIIDTVARVSQQRITLCNRHFSVNVANVVEVQIHQRHLERGAYQLIAVEGFVFQKLLLFSAQDVVNVY